MSARSTRTYSRAHFYGVNKDIAEAVELLLIRAHQMIKMIMNMNPMKFVSVEHVFKGVRGQYCARPA